MLHGSDKIFAIFVPYFYSHPPPPQVNDQVSNFADIFAQIYSRFDLIESPSSNAFATCQFLTVDLKKDVTFFASSLFSETIFQNCSCVFVLQLHIKEMSKCEMPFEWKSSLQRFLSFFTCCMTRQYLPGKSNCN